MAHGVLARTTEIVCIGRANLGSPSLPCCSPACAGARTRPLPRQHRQHPQQHASTEASMTSSVQGLNSGPPLVPVLVGFRRTRQPSPVRPYTGLTWYRTYQIDTHSQTVARHSPKAGDHTQELVLHDNADPFGKLSRLLAVCSAAYKSALMEISEPMMTRSSSRGRGRRLPGQRPSASCGAVRLFRLSVLVSGVWTWQADAGCAGAGAWLERGWLAGAIGGDTSRDGGLSRGYPRRGR